MKFIKTILLCYRHPKKAFDNLKLKDTPFWGFYGVLIRSLIILSVNYIPAYFMHKQPVPPSFISFIPNEQYYGFLIIFAPIFFILEWLLFGAVFHFLLKIFKANSNIDKILNISGVIDLAVQPLLTLSDIIVFIIGTGLSALMGFIHLGIVMVFATYLSAVAFKRVLGLKYWVGIGFVILTSLLHLPIAILFLRP